MIDGIDGLQGCPGAIAQVFPKAEIRLCVVHQIRSSLRYVVSKNQKAFLQDLRNFYRASSKEFAEQYLVGLEEYCACQRVQEKWYQLMDN